MLLFPVLMLASQTSAVSVATAPPASAVTPAWTLTLHLPWRPLELELHAPCLTLPGEMPRPCPASTAELLLPTPPLELFAGAADAAWSPPSLRHDVQGTLGGFMSFDWMAAVHLSSGPQFSWLTPDSPREDLPRLRVVAPGWAVRYRWDASAVCLAVAASTRFVMLGEDWPLVDVLTSEARVELPLP